MKNLILLLALAMPIAPAMAEDIATARTETGGEIIFTDTVREGRNALLVYARQPNGEVTLGEWVPAEKWILVKWDNGQIFAYGYDTIALPEDSTPVDFRL